MTQEGSVVNLIIEHLSEIMLSSLFLLLSISMMMFMYSPEIQQQNLISNEIYDSLILMTPGTKILIEVPFNAKVEKNSVGFQVKIDNAKPTQKEIKIDNFNFEQNQNELTIEYKMN